MNKFLAFVIVAGTLQGCAMSPEMREALADGLSQVGQNYRAQSQYQAPQSYPTYEYNAAQEAYNQKLQNDICEIRRAQGAPYVVGAPGGC